MRRWGLKGKVVASVRGSHGASLFCTEEPSQGRERAGEGTERLQIAAEERKWIRIGDGNGRGQEVAWHRGLAHPCAPAGTRATTGSVRSCHPQDLSGATQIQGWRSQLPSQMEKPLCFLLPEQEGLSDPSVCIHRDSGGEFPREKPIPTSTVKGMDQSG